MEHGFMSVFNPDRTLVKDFNYWVILVRENQITLGDCYIVLKREISNFGEMKSDESAELATVMKWYERRCKDLFGAEKFNYVAAMMRDNFVHFHAFPRYSKPVYYFGREWIDESWPRVIKFGPSSCSEEYCKYIRETMKE